jgi:ubiquinone/menaquinone biosynthesis C-methylase UbiE/DNA-binding transcriptional ArsR family regulator
MFMHDDHALSLSLMLDALKAAGEETRLRILFLLTEGELSVSDLTDILKQSQPRISRHLKLLSKAGLIRRHREGAWAFFRLSQNGILRQFAPVLAALDPQDAMLALDKINLDLIRQSKREAAEAFFAGLAPEWDQIRALHAPEADVEAAMLSVLEGISYRHMIDMGAGTGRMLQLFGPKAERAIGLDVSRDMLAVARANLEKAGLAHIELRQGDINAPPADLGRFDLAIMHQVLHYFDDPARALRQVSQVLNPSGHVIIIDFASHALESLREKQGHRRLGFGREQMTQWLNEAGLDVVAERSIIPPQAQAFAENDALTVSIWLAKDRRIRVDFPLSSTGIA